MQCHDFNQYVADYVLGQLTEDQERQAKQHLAGCDACSTLLADTEEATALLPLALLPTPPPAELESRLLDEITGPQTLVISETTKGRWAPSPSGQSNRRLTWLWAASLLAAAAGLGAWIGTSVHAPRPNELAAEDDAARQAARAQVAQRIDAAQQKHRQAGLHALKYAALEGDADVQGFVAADPAARQWHLLVRGLPTLPAGRAYRVWLGVPQANEQLQWTARGVLRVDGEGSASLVIDMPEAGHGATRLMITDEPPGVDEPTGTPHLAAPL